MIQIKSQIGGLGNQLFRAATAIGLAKKYNDIVYFDNWLYGKYFCGDFNNMDQLPSAVESFYTERNFHYNEIPYHKNMMIDGYFQSDKYFQHCKKFVKGSFKLRHVNTSINIEPNACFIHVRRGDYKLLPQHHPLKTWDNYYHKAFDVMDSYFPVKYYIFSDEPELVKSEFPEHKYFEYISGGDEITDLYLMTKCKYHIIGNSTFSWWGAYLSNCENTVTIAPNDWFGTAYSHYNTKDLLPEGWLRV